MQESGGYLRETTQKKMKQCKRNLSTVVNCNMLKLSLITFRKMLLVFIVSSRFLQYLVCGGDPKNTRKASGNARWM
jgi:hypothetical protein